MRAFGAEKKLAERKWPELSEAEEKLHNIIVPENKAQAIDPEGFSDLYTKETVARDKAYVAKLEDQFRKDSSDPESESWLKRGELFEAIVNDQIDASNWLGENASVTVPSRYDDIVNKVDSIVEFEREGGRSHLALAVDITKSVRHLDKKFGDIKESIEGGQLSRVKYFSSHNFRGELREIPRVVIGADQETMQDVAELLLLFKTRQKYPAAGKPGEFKEARRALEKHPLRFIVFTEIIAQLEAFESYARSIDKTETANKYREAIEVLSQVPGREEGRPVEAAADAEKIEKDKIHQMILDKTKSFGHK